MINLNDTVTIHSQTSVSYIDIETLLGARTFIKNMYFLTIITALCYCLWSSFLIYGCSNTVQSHAYALSNLHTILVIPLMTIKRGPSHKFQKLFSVVIVIAISLLLLDRWSSRIILVNFKGKIKEHYNSSLYTDLLLVASNIPAFFFYALNRALMQARVLKHLIILIILVTLIFVVSAIIFEDATLNLDSTKGIFGWMNSELVFTTVFLYGFLSTFFGSIGYIIAMQYYSPLICSSVALTEPIIA